MQQDIWADLTTTLPYLADLQAKIETLQTLKRIVNGDTDIEILIHHNTPNGVHTYNVSQEFVPFNIKMEVQILLNDAIDHLQQTHLQIGLHLEEQAQKKNN